MDILHSLNITPAELVTQLIGFIILIWLLNKFLTKPIIGILDERQADIKATYDQLDADRATMERTRREYEERLAGIETQAREKVQAAVKEAQELRATIIADAKKQAETVIENGRSELERDRARVFAEMRQQIADLAIMAAGKVVGESMDDARHRALVDQFIGNIGAAPITSVKAVTGNGATSGTPGAN